MGSAAWLARPRRLKARVSPSIIQSTALRYGTIRFAFDSPPHSSRVPPRDRLLSRTPVRLRLLRDSCIVAALLAAGCSTPRSTEWRRLNQTTPLKADVVVWIWSPGVVNKWHAVSITQDSV